MSNTNATAEMIEFWKAHMGKWAKTIKIDTPEQISIRRYTLDNHIYGKAILDASLKVAKDAVQRMEGD